MKLRILVIDDEESNCEIFKRYLEGQGHEVLTASEPALCSVYRGHDCTNALRCTDIVLTDQRMPRMAGLEFIELQFKRGCKSPPENKVIITGNPDAVDMEKVRQFGCQVCIKPIQLTDLDEIVRQVEARTSPDRKLADLPLWMNT